MQADSPYLHFQSKDFQRYIDFTSLRYFLTAITENKLCIATENQVIILNGIETFGSNSFDEDYESVQALIEFNESSGAPTVVCWLSSDILCIGFEQGDIVCVDSDGTVIREYRFLESPVRALRISAKSSNSVSTENEEFVNLKSHSCLWILYEGGELFVVC
jgi:hypothetical protein